MDCLGALALPGLGDSSYVTPCLLVFVARWIFLGLVWVDLSTSQQQQLISGCDARYPGTCYIFKQNVKSLYLVHKLNLLSTADLLQKQPTTSIFIGDVF